MSKLNCRLLGLVVVHILVNEKDTKTVLVERGILCTDLMFVFYLKDFIAMKSFSTHLV